MSVYAGSRRADLSLPDTVPVAELLPDLAATLGLADPRLGESSLVLPSGVALSPDGSLASQGVGTGTVLSVVTGTAPPVVSDDPVEAVIMALDRSPLDAVARGSRLALGTVVIACLGGLLAVAPGSPVVLAAPGALALGLLAGGVWLGPVWRPAGLAACWLACAFAALAGSRVVDSLAAVAAAAGGAAAGCGLLAILLLGRDRVWLAPPVASGAATALVGIGHATGLPGESVAAILFALAVVLPRGAPWMAAAILDAGASLASTRAVREALLLASIGAAVPAAVLFLPSGLAAVPLLVAGGLTTAGGRVETIALTALPVTALLAAGLLPGVGR